MRGRISVVLVVLTVLSVALVSGAGCGNKVEAPTSTPVPTPTMAAEPLLIGCGSMLSGAGSNYGLPFGRGVELGVDMVNAGGGIVAGGKRYVLKLDMYDWVYTTDGGRTGAEKLINDGCKIITGYGTSTCVGAQQATEPTKTLFLAGAAADAVVAAKYPYTYRICMGADGLYIPAISYAHEKYPNNRKFFATCFNDATGKFIWDCAAAPIQALGWDKFEYKPYEPGTTDFAPFVTSYLIPSGADFFCCLSRSGEMGKLIKATREFGFKGVIVVPAGSDAVPEFKIAGEAADGIILSMDWDWEGPYLTDQLKSLARQYSARFGGSPTMATVNGIEACIVAKVAIEMAGSTDPTALKDVMPNIKFDSLWGGEGKMWPVGDRQNCTVVHKMPISRYDHATGKLVNVGLGVPPLLMK